MYGYAKGPELSVLALPPELLRRVVDVISNITHLWTRAQVSLVSKVFAAAVKEQHKLVISGAFLINQDEQFMLASLKQAPTAFVQVTQLTLTDIQRYSLSWSCSLASQSSLLKTLTIQLRTGSCDYASDVVQFTSATVRSTLWCATKPAAIEHHKRQLYHAAHGVTRRSSVPA